MKAYATVYRFGLGDCTLNGITSKKGSLYVSRDFDPLADLWIKTKNVCGEYVYAEPSTSGMWAMGGNYIQMEDKTFIPVHDRNMILEKTQEVA